MTKTLIKKQLLELFHGYFVKDKTGKARTKAGTVFAFILLALLFIGLGFAFYSMASGLGVNILGHGINWLYFALMGLLAIAFGVFGSVFNTYASLYLPKDNELLISMPIPNRTLLLSRLAGVYITSLMYSAWLWIPAIIAYFVLVPLSVANTLFPILLTFVLALFVSILSCVLGWVVALIAIKAKGKSILTVILSLAVMALYYVVYFKIVGSLSEIMNHIGELGDTVKSWLHYSYLMGMAADGDVISMLSVTAITIALAVLCFIVLEKTFSKFATTNNTVTKKTKAKNDYTPTPVRAALLNREYKHFTSVATWMLNGGFGLLLLPIGAVAAVIKCNAIREMLPAIAMELPELYALLPLIVLMTACFVISTNAILPVSVSIEGKSLWILQSLPIEPWQILEAKENMDVQMTVYPAILFVIVMGTVLKLEIAETALICCAVWVYIWMTADFGLFLNLKKPNFNWTNEATLTKQSMPVLINLFGGWAFCVAAGCGAYFLSKLASAVIVLGALTVLFGALWAILHHWLKTKGTEILEFL